MLCERGDAAAQCAGCARARAYPSALTCVVRVAHVEKERSGCKRDTESLCRESVAREEGHGATGVLCESE